MEELYNLFAYIMIFGMCIWNAVFVYKELKIDHDNNRKN